MEARRFDQLARALGRPLSRRGALGVLGGALGLLGAPGPALAQGGPGETTVCLDGQTLTVPEAAAQRLLGRGATAGPCGAPPPGASCQDRLFGLCTFEQLGLEFTGCRDKDLLCTPTFGIVVTACELPCQTDADCRQKFPGYKSLVCRPDALVCPLMDKCCVPR